MASKRPNDHETDDEGSSTKDIPLVKKKKYDSHWKSDFSVAFPELKPSRRGTTFAHCTVCNTDFQIKAGGLNDCKKHTSSNSHKTKKTMQKGCATLTSMLETGRLSSANDLQTQITKAEAMLCGVIADLNLSLASADKLTAAFKKMFPDSKIAAGMKCCRNKATAMVKEMSALNMQDLAKRMQRQPFGIATDGSNEKDKKQFPLVVTIEGPNGLVSPELLALPTLHEASTGENIFQLMQRELQAQGIPWRNLVAFGCDNANVMTGAHKGVYHFVREEQREVHLARCCLHLVHIGAQKGASCLPPVAEILVDIYHYFQKSVNRQEELKNLQGMYNIEQHKMLKHVSTRWLSIGRCILRLLQNWEPLHHFFREEKRKLEKAKEKKEQGKQRKAKAPQEASATATEVSEEPAAYSLKKVELIHTFLRSPTNRLSMYFVSYTVKVYDKVLLHLQTDAPMIHKLQQNLEELIKDLFCRFLQPAAVLNKPVKEVQFRLRENQKEDADLLIGSSARDMLQQAEQHNLRDSRIADFFSSVRRYFETTVSYLLEKLPLDDKVLLAAQAVDPEKRLIAKASDVDFLLKKFPCLLPEDCTSDDIQEEFSKYQFMSTNDIHEILEAAKKDDQTDRVDWIWHQLGQKHPSIRKLSCVMKGVLTIPHSSAACERIFSMVRKTCTEHRSSLLAETTEALLVLKAKPGNAADVEYSQKDLQTLKSAYYNSLKQKETF